MCMVSGVVAHFYTLRYIYIYIYTYALHVKSFHSTPLFIFHGQTVLNIVVVVVVVVVIVIVEYTYLHSHTHASTLANRRQKGKNQQ